MTLAIAIAVVLLLALLTIVSYVERVYTEMGKFLSREFADNIEYFEQEVEPRLGITRARAALSMALLEQLVTALLAGVLAFLVFRDGNWGAAEVGRMALLLIVMVVVFNRLLPFILFSRTRGRWMRSWVPLVRILIYAVFPLTLLMGFLVSVASLTQEHPAHEQPEDTSEAVEALIEAGQEEGILQEADRELIQSVVEFREKTVREVMTPRPEIVAVPVGMTVEQFKTLLKTKPYSRMPVYESSIDHVLGIVFAHDVLQVPDSEASSRTVGELMKAVRFVPESQRVSALLRELQRENVHLAVVIDEYGAVAGVVTIEDLVEELVGEIRDEHEAHADIVRESDDSYVVPGNMDVDRLSELFGVRPDVEAATVAGLVSELLGRIPESGEVVEDEHLRFEVLESTGRRVERLRIQPRQRTDPQQVSA